MSNPLAPGRHLDAWFDAWAHRQAIDDGTVVLTFARRAGRTWAQRQMERALDQYRASMHVVEVAQIMRGETRTQLTAGPCSEPAVEPCGCTYGLFKVAGAPGPYVPVRSPGIRREAWFTRCFVIGWYCPHHGRGGE